MVKNIILSVFTMIFNLWEVQYSRVRTDGYYISVYNSNLEENDYFENNVIVLIKLDEDGYCNVFEIPISKGNSVENEIIEIKNRVYSKTPVNSGIYMIDENKITIVYSIFNNPKHLLGRYTNIRYIGRINNNKLSLKNNHGCNLEFDFVRDENIRFRNYYREKKKETK